jgi:hypothetical protein
MDRPSAGIPIVAVPPDAAGPPDGGTEPTTDGAGTEGATEEPTDWPADADGAAEAPPDGSFDGAADPPLVGTADPDAALPADAAGEPPPGFPDAGSSIALVGEAAGDPPHAARSVVSVSSTARAAARWRGMTGGDSVYGARRHVWSIHQGGRPSVGEPGKRTAEPALAE